VKRTIRRAVAPIALVLLGTGCSAISQVNVISTEEEVQMGGQFSKEIEKDLKLVTDPEVIAYVDSLGQLLARNSDRTDIPYVIKVVDTDEVNAFALPGGYLYVNRGLIVTAARESELAGVMGHEIGHIVGRHSAKQISREMGVGALSAIILGNDPAAWSTLTAQVLASGTLLHYGREAELEADHYGIDEAYRAGIDPDGMVTFFEKLLAMGDSQPGLLDQLFSSHPPTGERISKGREIIASLPPKPGLTTDSARFHAIQKRLPPIAKGAGAGGSGG
jgi:predicted Zn-dependent protease